MLGNYQKFGVENYGKGNNLFVLLILCFLWSNCSMCRLQLPLALRPLPLEKVKRLMGMHFYDGK